MKGADNIQDEKLEENLLAIIDEILQYRQLHYHDDIIKTLKNIYCIKNADKNEVKAPGFSLKNLRRGFLSPFTSGRGTTRYRGIDGNIYYKEDLMVWSQVKPLLLELKKKIQNNQFRINW